MYVGRAEGGVNGGTKKWVGRWTEREELLRNSFREEIRLPMTDYTLSGRTGSALVWHSQGRTFAADSVQ